MLNEKRVRQHLDSRLSGLEASPERRARIRSALRQEPKEVPIMKRKMSAALAFALTLALLLMSLAIAENLNLFSVFGKHDERYARVAEEAALMTTSPVQVESPDLGQCRVSIDSAYFDGLSLTVAFRVENAIRHEPYTPTAEELSAMEAIDTPALATEPGAPGAELIAAFYQAVEEGKPFGVRQISIALSDHTLTEDGIDIWPDSASCQYDESGAFLEIRDYAAPLLPEIRSRDSLTLVNGLKQTEACLYFDGQQCYSRYIHSDAGQVTAVVPKTADKVRSFQGQGEIGGVLFHARVEASPLAAVAEITTEGEWGALLPEEADVRSYWIDATLLDENGMRLRTGGVESDGHRLNVHFNGTGETPQSLTLYLYGSSEELGKPDLAALDAIHLAAME